MFIPFGCKHMFSSLRDTITNAMIPYEFRERVRLLKMLAEREIEACVQEMLTKPQRIVGFSEPILLADAMREAEYRKMGKLEVTAPFLTFPRATPEQWNGDIDHVDTITGTYYLYVGTAFEPHYGEHLLKKFHGAPTITTALYKALGSNFKVSMEVDAYKSPASRFIIKL